MGVLALLLKWWTLGIVAILGVGVVAWCACKVAGRLRSLRKACPVVAVLATLYGGSKTFNLLPRFTADEGLTVTAATLDVPTNETDNAYLSVVWTGPDADQPLRVRDTLSEAWSGVGAEWLFDWRFHENGTNRATWWVDAPATNILPHMFYHLGNDLPPVEIDGDGVDIEQFVPTSKNVTIRYAVNPSALGNSGGAVSIERQGTDNVWVEMYRLSIAQPVTNTVTFPGFFVGENTRWRVRLEVGQ